MQAQVKMSDRLTFIVEGSTQKELFEKLAEVDKASEVFNVSQCGICRNKNVRFQIRTEEGKTGKNKGKMFKFYEMVCNDHKCRAKYSFGQLNEGGGLFPHKKDEEGNYLPNNGWTKFIKEEGDANQTS